MAISAVFFDAGDTLIHRWAMKQGRFEWLCAQAGIAIPGDPARRRLGARAHEQYFQDRPYHTDRHSPDWYIRMNQAAFAAMGMTDPSLAERLHKTAARLPETLLVDPDAPALLAALRSRGLRLAIVSNWDGSLVDALRPTGLSGYFDAVLDSDVVGVRKPDRRIFEIALAATGVRAEEALHVGDSPGADCGGALGAGIAPVLYDPLDLFSGGWRDLPPVHRVLRLSDVLAIATA